MVSWDNPFIIGGRVFTDVKCCAEEFDIPERYVHHMLASDQYPGCRYLTPAETTSYLQTLSIFKTGR